MESLPNCHVVLTDLKDHHSELVLYGLNVDHSKGFSVDNAIISATSDSSHEAHSTESLIDLESTHGIVQTERKELGTFNSQMLAEKHLKENRAVELPELKKAFPCSLCSSAFHLRRNLKDHIYRKHAEKQFACDKCDMKFDYHRDLKKHHLAHDRILFKCDNCDSCFLQKENLVEHLKVFTERGSCSSTSERYACSCGEWFETAQMLIDHSKEDEKHSGQNSDLFVCPICDKHCTTRQILSRHIRNVHQFKKYACDQCDMKCMYPSQLKLHQESHMPSKDILCSICHSYLKNEDSFATHMKCHAKSKQQFPCELCHLYFLSSSKLEFHMVQVHSGTTAKCKESELSRSTDSGDAIRKLIVCVCCDEGFATPDDLSNHIRLKPRKGHSVCKVCGTDYIGFLSSDRPRLLCRHALLHTADSDGKLLPTFTCDSCDEVFASLNRLGQHQHSHAVRQTFTCSLCQVQFTRKSKLFEHYKAHPGFKPHPCELCSARFTTPYGLKCHVQIHSSSTHKCETCDREFIKREHLKTHLLTHLEKHPFTCHICGAIMGRRNTLNKHMLTQHGSKQFACSVCRKEFVSAKLLQIHVNRHTNDKPFLCKLCSKGYWEARHLRDHLQIAHSGVTSQCDICGKQLRGNVSLKMHKALCHSVDTTFECKECFKKFKYASTLKKHILIHSKPFRCGLCSKAYPRQSELTTHIITHTNERPFACSQCSKTFISSSSLVTHKRSHMNELPFVCGQCDKRFKYRGSWKSHCSKPCGIARSTSLRRTDNPVRCKCCDKLFMSRKKLGNHLKNIVFRRRFSCDICNFDTASKKYLLFHIARVHAT